MSCRPATRPGWIVNVTNDGWFGISTGPYQHFQQARVSAIEQGLPLARAANTGISAVVDPLGRIINALPLGQEGILDSPLPRRIDAPVYARVGDVPVAVLSGSFWLLSFAAGSNQIWQKSSRRSERAFIERAGDVPASPVGIVFAAVFRGQHKSDMSKICCVVGTCVYRTADRYDNAREWVGR